jgi:hypothetical protein
MRKTPPWYYLLPRATRPSTLKGCVGTLQDGYVRNVPLPRVPREQHVTEVSTWETRADRRTSSIFSELRHESF